MMKSTYRERLDRVIGSQLVDSSTGLLDSDYSEPSDLVVKVLIDALLDEGSSEVVLVIDESESMRVVASNPTSHSAKLSVARLIADIANFSTLNKLNNCRVIRFGASGPSGNRRASLQTDSPLHQAFGKTPKSEKTAYLLRSALIRMSGDAHLIVASDFRSHMWRRNLNALIAAGPRVTLVHLVDVIDCDFVLSSDDQLELAIQPDPSPWNTPCVDSVIPPSDIHAYLTAFSELNDINLLGIVVQENTLEEIMCTFERAILHA
ncbi:MAG: hypothetical protein RL169_1945 [Armatimonadota bacterium]|jgi:hypothetical protein